jgi:hypothetical protein
MRGGDQQRGSRWKGAGGVALEPIEGSIAAPEGDPQGARPSAGPAALVGAGAPVAPAGAVAAGLGDHPPGCGEA